MHLTCYIKNCGKYILKPWHLSVYDSFIDLKYNEIFFDSTSNNISKNMAIYCLEALFRTLINQLYEEKGRIESQGRYLQWFLQMTWINVYIENYIGGKWNIIIGPLLSHLRVLDDEFEEFLAAGKLSKVLSWFKNLGMHVL